MGNDGFRLNTNFIINSTFMKMQQLTKVPAAMLREYEPKLLESLLSPKKEKGFKIFGDVTVEFFEHDADNIVRDLVTAITTFERFKKPRFVDYASQHQKNLFKRICRKYNVSDIMISA